MRLSPRFELLDFLVATCTSNTRYLGDSTSIWLTLLLQRAGPIGLLGNLASVISIADPWRVDSHGQDIKDLWWVYFLNAVSLTLGCSANVVLAFLPRKLFLASFCYFWACLIYVALIVSTDFVYYKDSGWSRTQGFWQCVCAASLYLIAGTFSITHSVYYRVRRQIHTLSPKFLKMELLLTIYLFYICIVGAAYHARTMLNCSFANGVYFAIVTCLTLGFGDLVPTKTLPRALDIPMVYIGLVLGGLVTVSIFEESSSEMKEARIIEKIEKLRKEAYVENYTQKESFDRMRHIVYRCSTISKLNMAALTLSWLVIFWLIGALVFHFTESWSYFPSVYTTAISLASVGYGDFVPSTPGGRSFFIHWALMAVPTVATTVSNVYSVFNAVLPKMRKGPADKLLKMDEPNLEYYVTEEHQSEGWVILTELSRADECDQLSYEVWNSVIQNLVYPEKLPEKFWLSKLSPLRNPTLDERTFLLLSCSHSLDRIH